jgi:hypothetical protein
MLKSMASMSSVMAFSRNDTLFLFDSAACDLGLFATSILGSARVGLADPRVVYVVVGTGVEGGTRYVAVFVALLFCMLLSPRARLKSVVLALVLSHVMIVGARARGGAPYVGASLVDARLGPWICQWPHLCINSWYGICNLTILQQPHTTLLEHTLIQHLQDLQIAVLASNNDAKIRVIGQNVCGERGALSLSAASRACEHAADEVDCTAEVLLLRRPLRRQYLDMFVRLPRDLIVGLLERGGVGVDSLKRRIANLQ